MGSISFDFFLHDSFHLNFSSVEDNTRYAVSYKNMTFRPGEINRSFVHVPHGATWAGKISNLTHFVR